MAEETGRLPLIGCVAEAVAGGAREVESGPAVTLAHSGLSAGTAGAR